MTIESGIEIPVTSRFKVLENPNALPGYCCVCHSAGGDGRQFIDFGFQLDVFGAVYFCTFCVKELALSAGFIDGHKHNQVTEEFRKVIIELDVVNKSFGDYRDAVRSILRGCACSDKLDSGSPVDSKPSIPNPRSGKSGAKGDDHKSD